MTTMTFVRNIRLHHHAPPEIHRGATDAAPVRAQPSPRSEPKIKLTLNYRVENLNDNLYAVRLSPEPGQKAGFANHEVAPVPKPLPPSLRIA